MHTERALRTMAQFLSLWHISRSTLLVSIAVLKARDLSKIRKFSNSARSKKNRVGMLFRVLRA